MTHLKTLLAALMMAMAAVPAQAATLSFDFDGSAQGWALIDKSGKTTGTKGILTAHSTGGASGGYLSARDKAGGRMELVAPSALNGDLSRFLGGNLSFMLREIASTKANAATTPPFGRVYLRGGGRTIWADGYSGQPSNEWRAGGVRFTADTFRVDDATFRNVLADVSLFSITMESRYGLVETTGIDSLSITPVPLPAGAVLLLAALAGLGLLGYRRTRPPLP